MKTNTKLQTKLSFELFNFIKSNLTNFSSEKISFKYLIHSIVGQWPKFLTDLIYKANSQTNLIATIHFDLLESTLKNLILKFTMILFTKLNYREIFALPITISLHKIENWLQICFNIARLHLYLIDKYQLINYIKFNENFQLRSKRFKINSKIETFD